MDNYVMINGKRVELTDEQVRLLRIVLEEKKKNPFDRVAKGDAYCFINMFGEVDGYTEQDDGEDNALFKRCNYFNDDSVAQQIALHQLLYRKLLKFTYDNACEDDQRWDCENRHWCIRYDHGDNGFDVTWNDTFQYSDVYFSTMESAARAINEVIEPFMKEHPDFVW
nr:MAG TPA: Protein of unknown function (DUF2884) [Caudoviricetes sp.]